MGTRSRIGIKLTNGNILSSYHHYDGYPQWLGKKLVENFNSYEDASELIDGGDMSVCHTTDTWGSNVIFQTIVKSDGTTVRRALKNEDGTTMYDTQKEVPSPLYYSERGESGVEPRIDETLNEYLNNGEEYAYVFENDSWVCYDLHNEQPVVVSIPN